MDELLGRAIDGAVIDTANIAATLLQLIKAPRYPAYTLHAELEGQKLALISEELLAGWQAQGYDSVVMADYYHKIKNVPLPTSSVHWGELPGCSGEVIVHDLI